MEYHDESRDNFDRAVTAPLSDIIAVAGEKDFTPERLRYYKDGTRRHLQYGTDGNYSETNAGHLLEPDPGQTLTLTSAERAFYPVGNDVWASMSQRLTQAPQAGDAAGSGYGTIDLANFDPATETWSGTTADGYFGIFTADTGLDSVFECIVQEGDIVDSRTLDLRKSGGILSIYERRLNWYDVGPSVLRQTYTNTKDYPDDPQRNDTLGAVANDDGKAAAIGSQRMSFAVSQASGNDGLAVEAGSLGVRTPGPAEPQYKTKGHSMDLTAENGTEGTYEVVGAMRAVPDRPTIKLRFTDISIISTPGSSTTKTRVMLIAVGPSETDAESAFPNDHADASPVEHSAQNSVLEVVENNTLTGPIEDDANTDVTGPATANTMQNPGGYQLGRDSVTPEGTGSKTTVTGASQSGNRELYDTDICLVLLDASTTGTCEVDIQTEQNS
jgi:hypothetical protein